MVDKVCAECGGCIFYAGECLACGTSESESRLANSEDQVKTYCEFCGKPCRRIEVKMGGGEIHHVETHRTCLCEPEEV